MSESLLCPARQQALVVALAQAQARCPGGVVAEFGVYKGGSAKLLCEHRLPGTPVHLFDSWQGLSTPDAGIDGDRLQGGWLRSSLAQVTELLAPYDQVHYHKGWVKDTISAIGEGPVAFAHVDLDLYEPTLAVLQYLFCYGRTPVVVIDDYSDRFPGIKAAVDRVVGQMNEFSLNTTATILKGQPDDAIKLERKWA